MRTLLFSLLLLLSATACQNRPEAGQESQTGVFQDTVPAAEEDAVMLQLSAYLIADPATQADTQQNRIINYAIDELIPLQQTSSGLFYRILEEGEGEPIEWGDYLAAHYKGYFLNGEVFDSSYPKGKPMEFYVGNMIKAWNEGLQLLSPGGRMLLIAPAGLAYGAEGVPGKNGQYIVPPNEPLVFELEVIERLKRAE